MKQVDKTTRAISRFAVQALPRLDERVREHVYEAFANSTPAPAVKAEMRRWRLFTSSRVAQLAAAAVIVVIWLLGLYTWDLLGTQAYAVEDTVKALRKIETAHAFCTDWKGRHLEVWMQPDPVTGRNDFISLVEPERNSITVSTPRVSYIHDTRENSVRFVRGQVITSSLNLASIIESLTTEADRKEESIVITRQTIDQYGEVIAIHHVGSVYECEVWVDPKTKLLVRLENIRCSNPGEVLKSIDEIRYNEPVPEWLLHFQCPEDAVIKPEQWGDLDDPNCGIDATGLSDEEACREVLMQLFEAINAPDFGQIRRLAPVTKQWNDGQLATAVQGSIHKLWDDSKPGVAAYEIGSPYEDKACPLGLLVPCTLTDHKGQQFVIDLIVRFRQTGGRRRCVVVFTWGALKPRPGAMHQRRLLAVSDSPFGGPINAALFTSPSAILIVPTNEADEAIQQRIHNNVRSVQKMLTERVPHREVKILPDVEALEADLSQSSVGAYGTPQGNLWLAQYMAALPVVIEANSITMGCVYEGSDLRFISAWPHPQNPNMGLLIYTAQRAEDVIGINALFHGPTDYVVARGETVVHSAYYVKKKGQWTLP